MVRRLEVYVIKNDRKVNTRTPIQNYIKWYKWQKSYHIFTKLCLISVRTW